MSLEKTFGTALNLLFPSDIYCAACGNLIDGTRPYALCDFCVREMEWHVGNTCSICGKALAPHRTGGICSECCEWGRAFDAGISCCSYAGQARDLVRTMKYKDSAWIAGKLADVMYDRWTQLLKAGMIPKDYILSASSSYDSVYTAPAFIVVHVPMTETKKRKRGYDQAEIIARRLASLVGAPFAGGILRRALDTAVMSKLGAHERRVNMERAFEVDSRVRSLIAEGDPSFSHVMLVDDVFTTGSTADACSATLKDVGVKRVILFTFASGADMDQVGSGES
ncbi:MAG: ComF family protein [Clostridiales Family XIII bacterium]|jgi:ComF family protein|nr:ComF family protein [Clostridiales Family XIII bacterium]